MMTSAAGYYPSEPSVGVAYKAIPGIPSSPGRAVTPECVPVQEPKLIRPVARRMVARPIPHEAVERFYDEAYELQLPTENVQEAILLSQEWHKRWIQQDTTMPPTEQIELDRVRGARNPSPEESVLDRKRVRMEDRDGSISSLSSKSTSTVGPSKKKSQHPETELIRPKPIRMAQPALVQPTLVRPKPRRLKQPTQALPVVPFIGNVPRHIHRAVRISRDNMSLSPLTLPSVTSSYRHSRRCKRPDIAMQYPVPTMISHEVQVPQYPLLTALQEARDGLLRALASNGGDSQSSQFLASLAPLAEHFSMNSSIDTRCDPHAEGMWLTITKPTFFGNLGDNDNGDPLYTLGRMSFDMFSPSNLVCSLQGNFNEIERVVGNVREDFGDLVPKSLRDEVQSGEGVMRTYNIVTAFTIESHAPAYTNAPNKDVRRPIRGVMTTYGYTLPDPEVPNRLSVWITGGKIEPNDTPEDQTNWLNQFVKHPPKHGWSERAKLLAVQLLMGAELPKTMMMDGSMEYTFTRPLGGHGLAFVDTLYVDDTLRVVRGHRGTHFVFLRHPKTK